MQLRSYAPDEGRGLTLSNPSSSFEVSAAETQKATEAAKDLLSTSTEFTRSAGGANVYEPLEGFQSPSASSSDYEDVVRSTKEPLHGNAPGDDN